MSWTGKSRLLNHSSTLQQILIKPLLTPGSQSPLVLQNFTAVRTHVFGQPCPPTPSLFSLWLLWDLCPTFWSAHPALLWLLGQDVWQGGQRAIPVTALWAEKLGSHLELWAAEHPSQISFLPLATPTPSLRPSMRLWAGVPTLTRSGPPGCPVHRLLTSWGLGPFWLWPVGHLGYQLCSEP